LDHLALIADHRLSVQVVPPGRVRFGLLAGFSIATVEDGGEVAYLETAIRGLTTSDRDGVAAAAKLFEVIRVEALPLCMSVDLIGEVAKERWT
jgi:hypothetical protein